jgi:hypothetical protein
MNLFLFDVDGVIIDPRAYRLGINRTLTCLFAKIGLQNLQSHLLSQSEIAFMESRGIHDVWDITNIIFCLVVTTILFTDERAVLSRAADPDKQMERLQLLQPAIDRCHYLEFITEITGSSHLSHPPDAALESLQRKLPKTTQDNVDANERAAEPDKNAIRFLRSFLIGTRTPYQSYGTRTFQNILLGSKHFEETYGLRSTQDGQSFLRREDRVLISPESVKTLRALCHLPENKVGIYTARPSLSAEPNEKGFSPEAELALDMAGMTDFPLVAMGMMEWLAARTGTRAEDLTKPNTTQAVAALMACIRGKVSQELLEQAFAFDKCGRELTSTALVELRERNTTVYVFEDTVSGIKPMLEVGERLEALGLHIKVQPLGVSAEPSKIAALSIHAKQVYPDVNTALKKLCAGATD